MSRKTTQFVWELVIDGTRSVHAHKATADKLASEAMFGAKRVPKITVRRIYLRQDGTWS